MKKIFGLLSLFWMALIFYFSNQPAKISDYQSDKTIAVLNYLSNNVDLTKYKHIQFIVRKCAHFSLYFVLGIMITIAIYFIIKNIHKASIVGLLVSILYSMSDELHQVFVSGRSASIKDVGIDTCGALCGIILIRTILKISTVKSMSKS